MQDSRPPGKVVFGWKVNRAGNAGMATERLDYDDQTWIIIIPYIKFTGALSI
jgi:hypothetical protein